MIKRLGSLALVLLAVSLAAAGTISVPNTFSPNTTIESAKVNQNFSTIYNDYNGNISDANIASITETKLTFTGTGHDHSGGTKGALVAQPNINARLTFASATQIKVIPYQGNRLFIKKSGVWTATTIASAGITANNTSIFIDGTGGSNLGANTTYYVYLFDNSGTTTIDFSATGHGTDSTTGVETKSAVDTRVLVGMVRTNGSNQFTSFLVLSWFNRGLRNQQTTFSSDRSTASTTYVELNTEIQNTFLTWGDEAVGVTVNGSHTNSGANADSTAIAFDGTSAEAGLESAISITAGGVAMPPALAGYKTLSEGYHYATLLGKVQGGTGTWHSSTTGSSAKIGLHIQVRG